MLTGGDLLLDVLELVQIAELIALTVIGETLAVYLGELVVVAVDFDLLRHQVLKPVVVALHDQVLDPSVAIVVQARAHLAVDEIVVAISKHEGHSDAHLDCDLVIMSIDSQALDSVLFRHLDARIVLVQRQIHVLHRCRMMTMLRWSSLILILWHCKLLSCSSRRLLALVSLIAGLHLMSSNQLV